MPKWEIVRGVATDWKQHKSWRVMTYTTNGPTPENGVRPRGPFLVHTFDGTDQLYVGLPYEAVPMFDRTAPIAGRAKGFFVPATSIWARQPATKPEEPNVIMTFDIDPWTLLK